MREEANGGREVQGVMPLLGGKVCRVGGGWGKKGEEEVTGPIKTIKRSDSVTEKVKKALGWEENSSIPRQKEMEKRRGSCRGEGRIEVTAAEDVNNTMQVDKATLGVVDGVEIKEERGEW